jgi:[acyl-carrier-protein] S-malonyltransferase
MFPGQGAQTLEMLEGIAQAPSFKQRYGLICQLIGNDPIAAAQQKPAYLTENIVSSLLTVLVSSLSYELLESRVTPRYLAGYSVGQWTALWAAKAISFECLVALLAKRAELMNECLKHQPSGMIAVIGLNQEILEDVCQSIQAQGHYLLISNYNAPGQFTLAGTEPALQLALAKLEQLKPKKYQRIPVSGAWHCPLLKPAAEAFRHYLEQVALSLPLLPVLDNVTGKFLPTELNALKDQLAAHVCAPVLWHAGMRFLISQQCQQFTEVGYGKTLTKFGFFIDRSVAYQSFYNGLD